MSVSTILQIAFGNIAAHISNLDEVRDVIDRLVKETTATTELLMALKGMTDCTDVTLRTDLRILLNEVRHVLDQEPHK
jgi:hypothetical protein